MTRHRMAMGLVLAITATVLGAAGCGDDDDGDRASPSLDPYCDASLAIELLPEPDIDAEAASPDEISESVQRFVTEQVLPLTDAVEPVLPDEIRGAASELISTFEAVRETGDLSLLEASSFERASAAVHAFDLEHCGWARTSLSTVDFAFDGSLPSTAGITSMDVTNDGDELHLAILGRKKAGVDASAADAFAGVETEEQFDEVFDFVSSVSVPPGGDDYVVVDLEPGEYVLFCPIPVGTTSDTDGDGPPHFTQGMVETFTVA